MADSYTVTLPPGFAAIANHLDNGAGNRFSQLFPNALGSRDGDVIFKYNCLVTSSNYYVWSYWDDWVFDSGSPTGFSDSSGNPKGEGTLAPGEGAVYGNNQGLVRSVTFTGTPVVPVLPYLPCGCFEPGKNAAFSFVSRQVKGTGTFEDLTGLVPGDDSVLLRWTGSGWTAYVFGQLTPGQWDPETPIVNVGEAVLIRTPCYASADLKKWNQPPVPVTPTNVFYGWNQLSVEYPFLGIAADDWVCTNAEPVTKIRWWGSFLGWTSNTPPFIAPNSFLITIMNDVPAYVDAPYSHPDGVIWQFICQNFTAKFAGWDYDPQTGRIEACFLFEQTLTPAEYFVQPGVPGTIYWISIAAQYAQGTAGPWPYGWKTRPRDPASLAPDDAVMNTTGTPPWAPLYWPTHSNSWDLAFELISGEGGGGAKWEQWPDLSFQGMDVRANRFPSPPHLLADDFLCTIPGYVTNITIWGSWSNDFAPGFGTNATFTLSIHEDIPAFTAPWFAPYSMPGTNRWTRTFPIGQYKCSILASNLEEGWFTPPGAYKFPGDTICYQYDFNIGQVGAFFQEGNLFQPKVYWLDVQAQYPGTVPQFGWKTCLTNWNDSAVWVNANEPYNGMWNQLMEPTQGRFLDLAFRINSAGGASEIKKWSQPPVLYPLADTYDGWNQSSVEGGQFVADDWACTNPSPVTDLHWWGSFINWNESVPPQLPDAFQILIWTDVPAGFDAAYSHPGAVIWQIYCTNFTWSYAGLDLDPRYPWAPPEACFKFEQYLNPDEWFIQSPATATNIYWISIAAVYNSGQFPPYPWGWKTRPRDLDSLAPDDAVISSTLVFPPWEPLWWPDPAHSWDMAFALTTREVQETNCIMVVCPTNLVVTCAPTNGAIVTFQSYATNFCTGAVLPATCTPPSGSLFPVGMTQVCCTNITPPWTNYCCFTVTVLTDTTAPAITCPTNLVAKTDPGLCSKSNVTFVVTAVDDCDASPTISCSPPSGSTFPKGVTTVVCRAWDVSGHTNTCNFTVTIRDQEVPGVTCSTNIVANTDPGRCSKSNVTFTATASDNCPGVTVACVPPSGSTFAKGVTTVRCTATDTSGNTNSCAFTVTILDQEPPGVTCSTNILAYSDLGRHSKSNVTFTSTASDNCPGVALACVPPSGSTFPKGVTTVTCTATDTSGNTNACSFTVTIVQRPPSTNVVITNIAFTNLFNGWNETSWHFQTPRIADDWVCATTNPVTAIRWWGSYANWQSNVPPPTAVTHLFQISFWSDVPAMPGQPSHPNSMVWQIYPTNVTWRFVGLDFDPRTDTHEACFEYEVNLATNEWFYQQSGPTGLPGTNIYWINLASLEPLIGEHAWGWKTRPRTTDSPAPDAAVRGDFFAGGPYEAITWPYSSNLWDLAFELVSSCTNVVFKWEQPPDLSPNGMDVRDCRYINTNAPLPYLLADDFPCSATGPLTDITLWGSWRNDVVPPHHIVSFTLSFHADIPAQGGTNSMPGQTLWMRTFEPGQYHWQPLPVVVEEGWLVPPSGYTFPGDHACYQYDFHVATNAFVQTNGTIYWLDVQARLMTNSGTVQFGWKTSPLHWNDDAAWVSGVVEPYNGTAWKDLHYPPLHPLYPMSLDLAFSLTGSDIANVLKWSQPPVTNRFVAIEWNAESGLEYQLQATTNLAPPSVWTNVGPTVWGPAHVQHDPNCSAPERYWRIMLP